MTVVDDKLLRGERSHTVSQQNVRLVRMFLLRDDAKRNHIFDELIKTAGTEFPKTARGFCGQPMTSVIVSVNDKPVTNQDVGKLAIASDVLAKSVRDLNDSPSTAVISPFHARDGEAVVSYKLEPLGSMDWFVHYVCTSANDPFLTSPSRLTQNLLQYLARAALWQLDFRELDA